jgi:hypothetical protein
MSNSRPIVPNLICPVPKDDPAGYFTTQQSQLNVSRKDKFLLIIDIPPILKPLLQKEDRFCRGGNLERLQMSIWGFVVPEITINKIDVAYGGQVSTFSGLSRPAYNPVSINFTVDNRFDNYYILYKWLDIQNNDTSGSFDANNLRPCSTGRGLDYKTTITVMALDEYEKPTAKWDYLGSFPTVLGAINASYRETDELESTFTFEFSQLKMSLL